jgi:hypothetical protein
MNFFSGKTGDRTDCDLLFGYSFLPRHIRQSQRSLGQVERIGNPSRIGCPVRRECLGRNGLLKFASIATAGTVKTTAKTIKAVHIRTHIFLFLSKSNILKAEKTRHPRRGHGQQSQVSRFSLQSG